MLASTHPLRYPMSVALALVGLAGCSCGGSPTEVPPSRDVPAKAVASAAPPTSDADAAAPDAKHDGGSEGSPIARENVAGGRPADPNIHHARCTEGGCTQACEPKARCRLSCSGGRCTQRCLGNGLCSAGCGDEGGCEQTCEGDLDTCRLSCPGGGCTQLCKPGPSCRLSCAGGGCTQTCEPGSECALECDAGKCTQSCDGAAECTKGA